MVYKQPSSGLPFKQLGSSPVKAKPGFDLRGYPTAKSIASGNVKGNIAYGYKTPKPTTAPKPTATTTPKPTSTLSRATDMFKKGASKILSKVLLPLTVIDAAYTVGMGNPKSAKATHEALKKEGKNKLKGINKTHVPKS